MSDLSQKRIIKGINLLLKIINRRKARLGEELLPYLDVEGHCLQIVSIWFTEPKLLLEVAKNLDDWLTQCADKKELLPPKMTKETLSIYQKIRELKINEDNLYDCKLCQANFFADQAERLFFKNFMASIITKAEDITELLTNLGRGEEYLEISFAGHVVGIKYKEDCIEFFDPNHIMGEYVASLEEIANYIFLVGERLLSAIFIESSISSSSSCEEVQDNNTFVLSINLFSKNPNPQVMEVLNALEILGSECLYQELCLMKESEVVDDVTFANICKEKVAELILNIKQDVPSLSLSLPTTNDKFKNSIKNILHNKIIFSEKLKSLSPQQVLFQDKTMVSLALIAIEHMDVISLEYILFLVKDFEIYPATTNTNMFTYAAQVSSAYMIDYFLANGTNLNIRPNTGYSAVQIAAYENRSQILSFLIYKRAEVDYKERLNPLFLAINNESTSCKEVLINAYKEKFEAQEENGSFYFLDVLFQCKEESDAELDEFIKKVLLRQTQDNLNNLFLSSFLKQSFHYLTILIELCDFSRDFLETFVDYIFLENKDSEFMLFCDYCHQQIATNLQSISLPNNKLNEFTENFIYVVRQAVLSQANQLLSEKDLSNNELEPKIMLFKRVLDTQSSFNQLIRLDTKQDTGDQFFSKLEIVLHEAISANQAIAEQIKLETRGNTINLSNGN